MKVRWHARSLNFHDYAVVAGLMPAAPGRIPMSDGAGEIVAVGPGVTGWSIGDAVMSTFFPDWDGEEPTLQNTASIFGDSIDGCAAEVSVVDASTLTAIPPGWTFAQAATLPCAGLTAWRALFDEAQVRPGQSVLVQGSGGVSVFALQFAEAAGATVYATSSSEEKSERLRALGADHLVNYRADPAWGETVSRLSGGGVDIVLDVGGPATLAQSLDAARIGGHIVAIGLLGGMEVTLPVPKLLFKQLHIRPIAVGSHAQQRRLVDWIAKTSIKPIIDRRVSFADMADALRYQLSWTTCRKDRRGYRRLRKRDTASARRSAIRRLSKSRRRCRTERIQMITRERNRYSQDGISSTLRFVPAVPLRLS